MSVPLVVQDVRGADGAVPAYVSAVTGDLIPENYRTFDAPVGDDLVLHVWQTGSPSALVIVMPTEFLAPELELGQPTFNMSATSCAVIPLSTAYKGPDNRCTIRVGNIDNGGSNPVWLAVLRVPR